MPPLSPQEIRAFVVVSAGFGAALLVVVAYLVRAVLS